MFRKAAVTQICKANCAVQMRPLTPEYEAMYVKGLGDAI